ncbi:MAG: arginine deiminase family protein [Alphaproteobacteria bacterium]
MTTRRQVVKSGLALGAAAMAGAQFSGPARAADTPFLTSDFGRLKKVLVHSVTPTEQAIGKRGQGLVPYAEVDRVAMARQQAGLMDLLRASGAEVIEVADALASAMEATRSSGVFAAWLKASFPRLSADPSQVTAEMILGRDASVQFNLGPDGSYVHRGPRSTSTMWTRDSAFMTPQGLVMGRAATARRGQENMLLRFLYAHAPQLKDYPIVFDAVEEGLIIEGGDAMVADAGTLVLGVGNRTDPRIAPVLARRLNMDVLTVQTVEKAFLKRGPWSRSGPAGALRVLLLHLDTYFTLVGPRHGLALPFLMEKAHSEDGPLARFIRGARADTGLDVDEAEAGLAILKGFGKVALFKAGTGKKDSLGDLKLVDYLRGEGYRLTFTGGAAEGNSDEAIFRHFMSVTYPEQRRQATNVVQAVPGRVIAYDGNPATRAALEADGVTVDTFEGRELWFWHGGPHCLTQPLERG